MKTIYKDILKAKKEGKQMLAVLIDPDKTERDSIFNVITSINESNVTHIFVGGSIVEPSITEDLVIEIKNQTQLPVLLFPGDINQITGKADAILFLSLISGRNPDYLIEKHVASVPKLRATNLEVIPTGYMLVESGKETAVARVSKTKPMSKDNVSMLVDTAKAGELLGMKLIYLEAGSGAKHAIPSEIINKVKQEISCPLIVGGGIRSKTQLDAAYNAGADLVVIGTAFEDDNSFFNQIN